MTMQPVSPGKPVPPIVGYWLACVAEDDTGTAYKKLVEEALDADIDEWWMQLEEMDKAGGYEPQPWQERLKNYYMTPMTIVEAMQRNIPFSWEEQAQKWPDDYEKDWLDFQELRMRHEGGGT